MLLAEVSLSAVAPGTHKIVIESRANGRTSNRNHAPRPFLYSFFAGLRRNPLNDFRYEAVDDFLFQDLAADVHSSGAGRRDPELGCLFVGVVFETVNQAELLNRSQSDAGENAQIWEHGQDPTEPKPGAFGRSQLHSTADDAVGEIIKNADVYGINALKAVDGHAISRTKLEEKPVRVHLHGLVGMLEAAPQTVLDPTPEP